MKRDILGKVEEALSSIDIDHEDIVIQKYDEYVGIKDESEDTSWTRNEWDIRAQSNSLDRMEKRTTVSINVRISSKPSHFTGKPKEDV